MRNSLSVVATALFALFMTACGATVYTDENFSNYQEKHKLVAVLPFDVSVDRKRLPEGVSPTSLKAAEKQEGYLFQQQLYTRFLKRYSKGQYTVQFQDVDKTNVILKRSGVTYDNLASFTKDEIAQKLGVDSVISGDIKRSKPMSTGAAVASAFLLGYSATNEVVVNMNLHDGKSGKLLWTYDHKLTGGLGSSADRIAEVLMKKSSKKFPYRKPS